MELTIKTHDRKLSASEEDLIRKKLNRLPRHLDDISDAEVVVTQERRRGGDLQIVQLTLRAHGTLLRAEESDRDLPVALDATLSRMDRHIERYKGRYARRRKSHSDRDALPLVGADGAAEPDAEEPPGPTVRTKRFTVQPMVREEAIEQMELLGHTFFIYWDADDKQYAVLYRRHNGDYGVLEPELER
jgi:putative sigma-54 modulation protein